MYSTKYFIRKEDADFMHQLLKKLGINDIIREDKERISSFTLEGYTMRLHILIDDIFERVFQTYQRETK
jgi:hypothetical protein